MLPLSSLAYLPRSPWIPQVHDTKCRTPLFMSTTVNDLQRRDVKREKPLTFLKSFFPPAPTITVLFSQPHIWNYRVRRASTAKRKQIQMLKHTVASSRSSVKIHVGLFRVLVMYYRLLITQGRLYHVLHSFYWKAFVYNLKYLVCFWLFLHPPFVFQFDMVTQNYHKTVKPFPHQHVFAVI